jgi:MEMO1 family protein
MVNTASRVREPAVAGMFYPARATTLARAVDDLVAHPRVDPADALVEAINLKAIVVPHAGYIYSGPTAASAYRLLLARRDEIRRIVLLGPAHRVHLAGLAAPSVDAFRTPLGDVPVDRAARDVVVALPSVTVDDGAHADEHSLEVHLPFLQRVLGDVAVLPLVVGRATAAEVADVLDALWGGPETLVIVSSDLSHYEDHESAVRHDTRTVEAIVNGDADSVSPYDACGAYPLRGLMLAAARHGVTPVVLDRCTSADTAGPADRVVGYAALLFTAEPGSDDGSGFPPET